MTQIESPKRKMQKKNDYQRHKLFRKIKRRRKAQAEAEQQIAEKQLRKKLKLPKFDRGEDELSTYKKQVEMFNDANSDPILPGRLVDRNRVAVNPETGDVMEVGKYGVEKTKDPYIYKYKNITFSDIRPQNAGIDKNGNFGFLDLIIHDYNSGKDIRIKPSKRGTFTKAAKQHGMSVQGFANKVLRNPSKYSAAMRKKANFAHNAASWKH